MAHVVPPFAIAQNFQVSISPANPVQNDRNQRQTARFRSLCSCLTRLENFQRVTKIFSKRGPHGSCGHPFPFGPNFRVRISTANRVPNNRNQQETARFVSLWSWLTRLENFPTVTKSSIYKGGTTWLTCSPLYYWAEFPSVDIS